MNTSSIAPRLLRHFHVLYYPEPDVAQLNFIYTHIIQLSPLYANLQSPDLRKLLTSLVAASIRLFNKVKAHFLPIPSKPHYTYNLRDLGRLFKGMFFSNVSKEVNSAVALLKLWLHECQRIFMDRMGELTNDMFNKFVSFYYHSIAN
jgi:dynein heavy chain